MFPHLRKILCAIDLTPNSAYSLAYALDLASTRDAEIVVLHVVEPLPAVTREHGTRQEEQLYYEKVREEARASIERLIDAASDKVAGAGSEGRRAVSKVVITVGHPMDEILDAADTETCDLILLGSHGRGVLRRTLLGSVPKSVLNHSRKPVLVVPLPSSEVDLEWGLS